VAAALFNLRDSELEGYVSWELLGLEPGQATVRNLWTDEDWAHSDDGSWESRLRATVPAHGVVMLRVTPAAG
jgi:hypothetical protein